MVSRQKKLQKQSIYAEYDEDGDGIVSDEELSHVAEIKKLEQQFREKHQAANKEGDNETIASKKSSPKNIKTMVSKVVRPR